MKANFPLKNLIIQKITGLSKEQLFLTPEIPKKFQNKIQKALQRLKNGEPIEYIIEKAEFYGYNFFVDKRVLIPRNDTEIMVDEVIEELQGENNISMIDIGTGSGCIPISIMKNSKNINKCYAIDMSKGALEVAKINIENHGFQNIIQLKYSNLLEHFLINKKPFLNESLIITANLPYIKNGDFENMDKETIEFEPDSALYGGEKTGFELYEKLLAQCSQLKKLYNIKEITLFIEIGFDQYEISKNYLKKIKGEHTYFRDNGGIHRCIKIEI